MSAALILAACRTGPETATDSSTDTSTTGDGDGDGDTGDGDTGDGDGDGDTGDGDGDTGDGDGDTGDGDGDGDGDPFPPLAGYWAFNGDSTEGSGTNIDLMPIGDPEYLASVSPGLGTALTLDGDDAAVGADFVKLSGDDVTIVAWAYAESLEGIWNTIVKNWGPGTSGQFHIGLGEADEDMFQSVLNNNEWATAEDPFPSGEWVHTAVVLDAMAGEHRLYINGALVTTVAYAAPLDVGESTGLGVGAKPNDDGTGVAEQAEVGFWNGGIDEVGMYNAALTPEQISTIYQNGLDGIQLDGSSE
ncbi:Dipeptide-binding ABC transporter, periplasmic substrate-binding component [Enhygromyxa salina]|uniref:Dipeptide-binding ABC transporter, periplasmic substrate-binding component n=2 Tax=Enhygromyxa salina TaxID=215803 RepID=A0A0C2D299_9BACT|nr:Dipeptide-binding ABC transporter, periplasmic substrate-binding component [Enhygromyxa salina]